MAKASKPKVAPKVVVTPAMAKTMLGKGKKVAPKPAPKGFPKGGKC